MQNLIACGNLKVQKIIYTLKKKKFKNVFTKKWQPF